jgi:hypothetical protein
MSKSKIAAPLWRNQDLTALRLRPAYNAGRSNVRKPGATADREDRAAWQLGRDEEALTRNFNRVAGFGFKR